MMYEHFERLKEKLFWLRHRDDPFVPAGTTPLSEPSASSSFSSSSFNLSSLKDLSFETKRLLVLAVTFLAAFLMLGILKSNYASYSSARAAESSSTSTAESKPISTSSTLFSEPPIDD